MANWHGSSSQSLTVQLNESQIVYYRNLCSISQLFLSDHHQVARLMGHGYDGVPPLLRVQDHGRGYTSLHQQVVGRQHVFLVHTGSLILQSSGQDYKDKYPLLLYKDPTRKAVGCVKLFISSRSHSLMSMRDFGWPLQESSVVRCDENGVPKFYLSSKLLLEKFQSAEATRESVLMMEPPSLALVVSKSRYVPLMDETDEDQMLSTWHETEKDTMHALKAVPALKLDHWPQEAFEWPERSRGEWPSREIMMEAMRQPVYAVPVVADMVGDDAEDDRDILWKLDFSEAELVLCDSLSVQQRQGFQACLRMLQSCPQQTAIYQALKTTFLWTAERLAKGDNQHKFVTEVLRNIKDFFKAKHIPHYFMPERNTLLWCEEDIYEDMKEFIQNLTLEDVENQAEPEVSDMAESTGRRLGWPDLDLPELRDSIKGKFDWRLMEAFVKTADLHAVQLHRRLHLKEEVSACIEYHQQVLLNAQSHIVSPAACLLIKMVRHSLAHLYSLTALHAYYAKEKKVYFAKAEDHLAISEASIDLNSAVHLSNYYNIRGQSDKVVELLAPLLLGHSTEACDNIPPDELGSNQSLQERLWEPLLHGKHTFDILACKMEGPLLPKPLLTNLSFAYNQLLGYHGVAVAMFDAVIMAGVLLSLAYSKLDHHRQALDVLHLIEDRSLEEQSDMNEKRSVAYLNMLAYCYKHAGDKQQAQYLLTRSVGMMPSPRNAARWHLMWLKTERARIWVLGGVGVVLATTATAMVAISLARSRP